MDHQFYMARAIELSKHGLGRTFPNPIVGAVIVSASGEILGEGFHAGTDHAEVVALLDCARKGKSASGSTLYVSLEPCNHTGKTPPCTQAILDAGITRVIYAVDDPNPVAQGGGAYLRSRGVEVVTHILEPESAFQNRAWLHKIANNRPYFTWKIASTFDGFSAALDGTSQWITSEQSRQLVQRLRAESDAILIGTGTALSDNPSLIPRGDTRRPLRIVMGERQIPDESHLMDIESETLIFPSRNIDAFMEKVKELGLNSVLVEAGATLGTALLQKGLVDEICWFQAPTLLGAGKKAIGDLNIETLSDRIDYVISKTEIVGPDLCTTLLPKKMEAKI